jgi:ligand-binding SRPBCC domain-containing protein
MGHSFQSDQLTLLPIELVFAFFANPRNLPLLMPAWQNARIRDLSLVPPPARPAQSQPAIASGSGSRVTLTFRPFPLSPIRVSWQSAIVDFAWDHHFTDRQLHGPFARWEHRHQFRPFDRGGLVGTLISDVIDYELPLGPLGDLAHRLFVRRQIERAFAYRQSHLDRILASLSSQSPQPAQP